MPTTSARPPGATPDPALISVVIPVRDVRPYLSACLDSVLGGPADGQPASGEPQPAVEVIAVDDASTDGSGELLDERARADSRLTVIHLDRARGPGAARNAGLASAAGRYVWFVDGDDLVAPGAVAAIAGRLVADLPDVLLVDHEEVRPDGRTSPSTASRLLRSAPRGLFSLDMAPDLVALTMTAWSKLFGRDFLIALAEPFRPGIHEDIPVTCAALLAGRITALDRVCYRYRRSRPGSFMATTSSEHRSVFSAYDEVLGMVRKRAEAGDAVATPAVQAAIFTRAIGHYAAVLEAAGPRAGPLRRPRLVPRGERRQFFARMTAAYQRDSPPGYRRPGGALGAKFWLVEHGAYRAYALLLPLNKLRVAARRAVTHRREPATLP